MIRIIISFTKILVAALVALLFSSCQWNVEGINGSGNVITQNRTINEDFTGVKVTKGLDVVVAQSNTKSVTVEADDNLADAIVTKVEDGILVVTSKYSAYGNISSKKITIKMPIIKSLEASGGSHLKTIGLIKSNDISIKSSSGSDLSANVESDRITAESSSGSHISLEGKALTLETSSSSGSSLEAENLTANEVSSQSSSGSNTKVRAMLSLDAKASGGSSIDYFGTPKQLSKTASSAGSVSQK